MSPVRIPLASNWIRYGMVLLVAVTIVSLSVANPDDIGMESTDGTQSYGPFGIDYGPLGWIESDTWAHGMGYALFTATLAYAFVAPVQPNHRRLALAVCLAIALGVCMELVQAILPYRDASGIEALMNTISACLVAGVWWQLPDTIQFGSNNRVPN
ncbi:VanZ family protein [Haladaptatus pallidirubidus]|nr:VanZ family protein [Haladaptatus pallidirubidus]